MRFSSVVVIALTSAAHPVHAQQSMSAAQAVASVAAVYGGVTTYQAHFTQTYFAHAYNASSVSSGTVTQAQGGSASWSWMYAAGQRVVVSGGSECTYDPARNEVYQTLASKGWALVFPFLQSGGLAAFTWAFGSNSRPGSLALIGTPIVSNAKSARIELDVDARTFHTSRIVVVDRENNENRLELDHEVLNAPVSPSTFTIFLPQNVTWVRAVGPSTGPLTCP